MNNFYCLYNKKDHPFSWRLKHSNEKELAYFKSRQDCINYYLNLKETAKLYFQKDKGSISKGLIPRFEGVLISEEINGTLIHAINFPDANKVLNPEETRDKLYHEWKIDHSTGQDLITKNGQNRSDMFLNSYLDYHEFEEFKKQMKLKEKKAKLFSFSKIKNDVETVNEKQEPEKEPEEVYHKINENKITNEDSPAINLSTQDLNTQDEYRHLNETIEKKSQENFILNEKIKNEIDRDLLNQKKDNLSLFNKIEKRINKQDKKMQKIEDILKSNNSNHSQEALQNISNFIESEKEYFEQLEKNNNQNNDFEYNSNDNLLYVNDFEYNSMYNKYEKNIEENFNWGTEMNKIYNQYGQTVTTQTPTQTTKYYYPQQSGTVEFTAVPGQTLNTTVNPLGNETMIISTPNYLTPQVVYDSQATPSVVTEVTRTEYYDNNTNTFSAPNYNNPYPQQPTIQQPQQPYYGTQQIVVPAPTQEADNENHQKLESNIKDIKADITSMREELSNTRVLNFDNTNVEPVMEPVIEEPVQQSQPKKRKVKQQPVRQAAVAPKKKQKMSTGILISIIGSAVLMIGAIVFIALYLSGIIAF